MTAETAGKNEVVLRDDKCVEVLRMDGESAIKLGHDLIHAGEKALEMDGRIHEDASPHCS